MQQQQQHYNIVKCQAGCILQTVQDYCSSSVDENNNEYLVSTHRFSQIGGIIATNAGGQYYTRYGSSKFTAKKIYLSNNILIFLYNLLFIFLFSFISDSSHS